MCTVAAALLLLQSDAFIVVGRWFCWWEIKGQYSCSDELLVSRIRHDPMRQDEMRSNPIINNHVGQPPDDYAGSPLLALRKLEDRATVRCELTVKTVNLACVHSSQADKCSSTKKRSQKATMTRSVVLLPLLRKEYTIFAKW